MLFIVPTNLRNDEKRIKYKISSSKDFEKSSQILGSSIKKH